MEIRLYTKEKQVLAHQCFELQQVLNKLFKDRFKVSFRHELTEGYILIHNNSTQPLNHRGD